MTSQSKVRISTFFIWGWNIQKSARAFSKNIELASKYSIFLEKWWKMIAVISSTQIGAVFDSFALLWKLLFLKWKFYVQIQEKKNPFKKITFEILTETRKTHRIRIRLSETVFVVFFSLKSGESFILSPDICRIAGFEFL